MKTLVSRYLQRSTSAAPLAVFRIALGLLLFASVVRFWAKGWIHDLYVAPRYFFPFYGFEFITSPGEYTYLLFAVCGISALFFAMGFYYRLSSIALFLSFTYIELIDKSTYLNHYYFISMICLMMIFLPANACFSFDSYRKGNFGFTLIPLWCVDTVKLFVCMIYIFAGLAKLNSEWLLHAQPLRIWLPAKNDLPFFGFLFNYVWVAYLFSWVGCLYDLSISFLLLNRKTRIFAYGAVVVFHGLTAILFPIGMFPYIMIATSLIFFSTEFHERFIAITQKLFSRQQLALIEPVRFEYSKIARRLFIGGFALFFILQAIMPFRYLLYPDELFWTEEGYRFSWRVMLMEKSGYAEFMVVDGTGNRTVVNNRDFLTPLQEKMVSTQPDMLLQFAHILRDHFAQQGWKSPQVYVDSYVALNGRLGRPLVDPKTDLARQEDSFKHKPWILPFKNEIKGF